MRKVLITAVIAILGMAPAFGQELIWQGFSDMTAVDEVNSEGDTVQAIVNASIYWNPAYEGAKMGGVVIELSWLDENMELVSTVDEYEDIDDVLRLSTGTVYKTSASAMATVQITINDKKAIFKINTLIGNQFMEFKKLQDQLVLTEEHLDAVADVIKEAEAERK